MSLAGLIPWLRGQLAGVRTVIPGKVSAVSRAEGRERDVDWRPGIGRRVAGVEVADGVQPSSPVCFPGGGGFSMVWPVVEGDEVLGLAADRNTDRWRSDREPGHAHSLVRNHSLSNSLLIPCSITAPEPAPADPGDDWILTGPEGEAIRLGGADGELKLSKSGLTVASLTLTGAGDITLTPHVGQSVNAGGVLPLTIWAPLAAAVAAAGAAASLAGVGAPGTTGKLASDAWTLAFNQALGITPAVTTITKGA